MALFSKNKKKKIKKKPSKKAKWLFRLVFLLGFMVALYPLVSRLYYRIDSNNQVSVFSEGVDELATEEIERRIGLARAYNESLNNVVSEDPYSEEM